MSLRVILHEVVQPYLVSIDETDVEARMQSLMEQLRQAGAAVPSIAASLEEGDLESTNLPVAIRRRLATRLREDTLPKSKVSNDPMARLRPQSFDQVIGHKAIKELLTDAILAARAQQKPLRHMLLSGPRGLGKTTLALALAHESSRNIRTLVGAQLKHPQDVTSEVLRWGPQEIIFIDEIHGMGKPAQEALYSVMEDGRVPVIEKRHGAMTTTSVPAAPVTIVGATTNPAKLLPPFRNRFGSQFTLPFYTVEEMTQIGFRSAQILGVVLDREAMRLTAIASRDNPRTLNELLIQLSDRAHARGKETLVLADVRAQLALNGYDEQGLRREERAYLETLARHRGAASLATMAQALDMEVSEVEATIEPWLIREGRIRKTSRGREIIPQTEVGHAG